MTFPTFQANLYFGNNGFMLNGFIFVRQDESHERTELKPL